MSEWQPRNHPERVLREFKQAISQLPADSEMLASMSVCCDAVERYDGPIVNLNGTTRERSAEDRWLLREMQYAVLMQQGLLTIDHGVDPNGDLRGGAA